MNINFQHYKTLFIKALSTKLPVIITAFSMIASTGFGQDEGKKDNDFREDLMFGLKAGVNRSNVYDSEGDQFKANPKMGFAGGAFLAIPLGARLGLQPEFLVSQKGFKATGMILGLPYSFTRTTTYLDVPIFIVFKPSEFASIFFGPQFSYLAKRKDVFENATSTIEQEQEFVNEDVRKNTLCMVLGLDFNISHVVIGARAGWDVMNNNGDGTSTTPRYKNVWLQATLGYRF